MPLVSIIVPCYNEQATIRLLLDAICRQTFWARHQADHDLEVIIADGMSTDQTRAEVERFQRDNPALAVRLVNNSQRMIPAALNCAIAAAQGRYIIRLDAHSVPAVDYVERCIEALEANRGENVGGVWEIRPRGEGRMERAIATAAAHPFGVGDARYRYTNEAGYVDTVPFGAFRKDVFEQFGNFDENLQTNEDYEFNARLRQGGGRVWLDPRIRSTYFARPDLNALSKQYWRYGFWKFRMLMRYPTTLRWRQALPPVFVLSLLILLVAALFSSVGRVLFGIECVIYGLVLAAGSIPAVWKQRDPGLIIAIPLAIADMHLSWGSGFLWSMVSSRFVSNSKS
jgi:glycosyltransferase involved in cell wall biosynthesis